MCAVLHFTAVSQPAVNGRLLSSGSNQRVDEVTWETRGERGRIGPFALVRGAGARTKAGGRERIGPFALVRGAGARTKRRAGGRERIGPFALARGAGVRTNAGRRSRTERRAPGPA